MIRPKATKTQSRRNISGIDSAVSKSRHISCVLSVVYCEWECVKRPDICSISKVGRQNQPESIRAPLKSASLDVSFTLTRHLWSLFGLWTHWWRSVPGTFPGIPLGRHARLPGFKFDVWFVQALLRTAEQNGQEMLNFRGWASQ